MSKSKLSSASTELYARISGCSNFSTDSSLSIDSRMISSSSFDSGIGKSFAEGNLNLDELATHAKNNGEPSLKSGKQELLENLINRFIFFFEKY